MAYESDASNIVDGDTNNATDEIFATGNHGKVVPCLGYEDKAYSAGPMAAKARELYWAFAHKRVAAGVGR